MSIEINNYRLTSNDQRSISTPTFSTTSRMLNLPHPHPKRHRLKQFHPPRERIGIHHHITKLAPMSRRYHPFTIASSTEEDQSQSYFYYQAPILHPTILTHTRQHAPRLRQNRRKPHNVSTNIDTKAHAGRRPCSIPSYVSKSIQMLPNSRRYSHGN